MIFLTLKNLFKYIIWAIPATKKTMIDIIPNTIILELVVSLTSCKTFSLIVACVK